MSSWPPAPSPDDVQVVVTNERLRRASPVLREQLAAVDLVVEVVGVVGDGRDQPRGQGQQVIVGRVGVVSGARAIEGRHDRFLAVGQAVGDVQAGDGSADRADDGVNELG